MKILSGVFADETSGTAGDDRNADRAADRERRPALEGLFRRSRTTTVPATPITPTTSNTACATIAAAAAPRRARPHARVAAGAIARKIVPGVSVRGALVQMGDTRSTARAGTGTRSSRNPFFCPDAQSAAKYCEDYLDERPQERLLGRRGDRGRRRRRAGGPRRADLRQARRRSRRRADEHQCGQGRRDRRGLCRRARSPARRTPTRCAWAMTASRVFCPTMPAAFWAAFRPGSRWSRASRSSRPLRS